MPFKSEAQRKWMYANKPEMAKKWQKHTPKGKKLPEKAKKAAAIALYKLAVESEAPQESKATLFAPLIPALATGGYVEAFMNAPDSKAGKLNKKDLKSFVDLWRKRELERGLEVPGVGGLRTGGMSDFVGKPVTQSLGASSVYDPDTRSISLNPRLAKSREGALGILAHELGHAEQFRKANPSRPGYYGTFGKRNRLVGGRVLQGLGGLGGVGTAYLSNDPETAFNAALAGSAASLPNLAMEAGASARGSRSLIDFAKEQGMWKNKSALQKLKLAGRSWIGMPTYLIAAAAPLVTYLARRAGGMPGKSPE